MAWDAWLTLLPDQSGAWRAPLLAALVVKTRAKTRSWLLPIATGGRFSHYERTPDHDFLTRIAGFLDWAMIGATRTRDELNRLSAVEGLLRRKIEACRRHSRLPQLVDLLLSRPLVSVPLAAKALRCSPQAIEALLPQLGATVREMSGRKRYRVWSI